MSTDIGPGDCVEAKIEMWISKAWTAPGQDGYVIHPGTRTVVVDLSPKRHSICSTCGVRDQPGLLLTDYPLMPYVAFCPCEWRKIGGSKGEHVKQFAEYLRERDAESIRRLVEHLP